MENENGKLGLEVAPDLGAGLLDVLLQLLDGVLEGGARVVDLVDDQDAFADQVRHLAQGSQVEPLGARDLGADGLDLDVDGLGQALVQGQADGLDGDVGAAGLLEERAQDAGGHVAAAADGDHQLRLEVGQDLRRGLLAQLVHLLFCIAGLVAVRGGSCCGIRDSARTRRDAYIVVRDEDFLDHLSGWRGGFLVSAQSIVSQQQLAASSVDGGVGWVTRR